MKETHQNIRVQKHAEQIIRLRELDRRMETGQSLIGGISYGERRRTERCTTLCAAL